MNGEGRQMAQHPWQKEHGADSGGEKPGNGCDSLVLNAGEYLKDVDDDGNNGRDCKQGQRGQNGVLKRGATELDYLF